MVKLLESERELSKLLLTCFRARWCKNFRVGPSLFFGVDRSVIYRWFTGEYRMRSIYLVRLEEELKTHSDYLRELARELERLRKLRGD
jgi:hypothetical protein